MMITYDPGAQAVVIETAEEHIHLESHHEIAALLLSCSEWISDRAEGLDKAAIKETARRVEDASEFVGKAVR